MPSMTTNPLTTVSLMLTLASLLGSFFYIQLSQWLRDLLALRQKTELNRLQGDEAQKRAIVECRIEYRRLASWHTYAVNLVVISFVLFVLGDGLLMLLQATSDPLFIYVLSAFVAFLVTFGALSFGLLWLGHTSARQIRAELDRLQPRGAALTSQPYGYPIAATCPTCRLRTEPTDPSQSPKSRP